MENLTQKRILVAIAPSIEKLTESRMKWLWAEVAGLSVVIACAWFLI